MKKTLENYFDDWTFVVTINKNELESQLEYCTKNIGLRGLKWDMGESIPSKSIKTGVISGSYDFVFRFKNYMEAFAFILVFDGTIKERNIHND